MQDGADAVDHPNPQDLERFLLGELSPAESRVVTTHLILGCPDCRRRMAPLAANLFGGTGGEVRLAGDPPVDYDGVLSRAFSRVAGQRNLFPPLAGGPPEPAPPAAAHPEHERCRALLDRCVELRRRDPESLVLTATAAVNLAERLEGGASRSPEVVDLRARGWAELGNALRGSGDLEGSESAVARSLEIAAAGTGDLFLLTRQMDLAASLLQDRERWDEAAALLRCRDEIYANLGGETAEEAVGWEAAG